MELDVGERLPGPRQRDLAFGRPVGISFLGRAFSEPTLIKLAAAFEQATRVRQPPRYLAADDETPSIMPAGASAVTRASPPSS